jgi:flagellar hook assembly protein FlgD
MEDRRMKIKMAYWGLTFVFIATLGACAGKPKAASSQPPEQAVLDSEPSSIEAEAYGLAPNGDLRYHTISLALLAGNRESVATWEVMILDAKGKSAVRSYRGGGEALPDAVHWDGKDDSGNMANEGTYYAELALDYAGRSKPSRAVSKSFLLALTPPSATIDPNPIIFDYSPSGQLWPVELSVAVKPALAKPSKWTLDIYDTDGSPLRHVTGSLPTAKLTFDGKTDSGTYLTTGRQFKLLIGIFDEFGNKGTVKCEIRTAGIPAADASTIATRRRGFSPTSASRKNTIDLLLNIGSRASMEKWRVQVISVSKGLIRNYEGTKDEVPEYIRWDGKDEVGNIVPEGSYYALLSVDYGNTFQPAKAQSTPFSVVTAVPSGSITVDPPTIALSDLGAKKPVSFTVQAKAPFAQIMDLQLVVMDQAGRRIASFSANWPNNKVQWNGNTMNGETIVPGLDYTVEAKVQDEYGNVGTLTGKLSVEGLPAATEPSYIEALARGLAPRGDRTADSISFVITPGNTSDASAWKVEIADEKGTVVRSFSGGKSIPARISWDGTLDGKILAPEGRYTALLHLEYGSKFAAIDTRSDSFVLDLTPPQGELKIPAGLFSPEGDDPTSSLAITASGASSLAKISDWSITVLDPGEGIFRYWSGKWPMSSPIIWDGTGDSGDMVESASEYPVILKLRDEFGNSGETGGKVLTDIIVMKTATGYRIRVPSIVFKPFTADYKDLVSDIAEKNIATLDLLAEKLRKFPEYHIRLEGHAVMINWNDREKGEAEQRAVLIPLSRSRADAIKAALVERRIPEDAIVTAGLGALDPIVPDSDLANRWKNRRVEFYLEKRDR